jgi:uncharacterized membrane protein
MSEAAPAVSTRKAIPIAKVTESDILKSIGKGLRDMQAAPLQSLAFGLLYAGFGWLILFLMIKMNYGSYTYPMVTGFPLVAPMAAGGLYEISRRLEAKLPVTWTGILGRIFGPGGHAIAIMAVVTTFAYIIWIDIAAAIYVAFFGMRTMTFDALLTAATSTPRGFLFLVVGNVIGAAIAFVVFSIMAISLPLIFDRDVDFVTAMITSVKAVLANPLPMLLWCVIIGFLLALSFVSLFAGLLVVFPLLGHTTWHIYRKVTASSAKD